MLEKSPKTTVKEAKETARSIRHTAMKESRKRDKTVITESIATARNEADALNKHA